MSECMIFYGPIVPEINYSIILSKQQINKREHQGDGSKKNCSMFPEWHHAVPESAYFKVPETLKTYRMYPISRFVYVLHWGWQPDYYR